MYIRYIVIAIVLLTSMIAIELFYLTRLHSFLGFIYEYLTITIPIGFRYILDKV